MKCIFVLVLCSVLVSCGNQMVAPRSSPMVAPSVAYADFADGSTAKVVARKLIKNGSIRLESVDVKTAAKSAEAILKKHGGYIENKVEAEDVTLAARIPAQKIDVSMAELATLGKVMHRRVNVRDVTEEYIDVDAKIRNLRVLRDRLKKLYSRSNKVEELLKVEKELARVQTELDSMEGRMKAMQKNIAYSELSISINKKRIPGPLGAVGKGINWIGRKLWVLN